MKSKTVRRRTPATLRENAETHLRSAGGRGTEVKGDAAAVRLNNLRLAHELELYQIELEMQNEELRVLHEQANMSLDQYDFVPAGLFTLHACGEIRELNLAGGTMLGASRATLVGNRLSAMVVLPEREAFEAFLDRIFATKSKQMLECSILRPNRTLLRAMIAARASPDGQECRAVMLDLDDRY